LQTRDIKGSDLKADNLIDHCCHYFFTLLLDALLDLVGFVADVIDDSFLGVSLRESSVHAWLGGSKVALIIQTFIHILIGGYSSFGSLGLLRRSIHSLLDSLSTFKSYS
jgi:hypothetical protein